MNSRYYLTYPDELRRLAATGKTDQELAAALFERQHRRCADCGADLEGSRCHCIFAGIHGRIICEKCKNTI